jgi:hypothetical protein
MRRAAKTFDLAGTPPQQATAIARVCLVASDIPACQAPHVAHVADGHVADRRAPDSRVADKYLQTGSVFALCGRTPFPLQRPQIDGRVSAVSAVCQRSVSGLRKE